MMEIGDSRLPSRFWSKVREAGGCWLWVGAASGSKGKRGYFYKDGKVQQAHRVAYETIFDLPDGKEIDHVCRAPLCVNPHHMRPALSSENKGNAALRRDNTSGFKGVSWCCTRLKWVAVVGLGKKKRWLGYFDDPRDAAEAYDKAAEQSFGEFALTNEDMGLL